MTAADFAIEYIGHILGSIAVILGLVLAYAKYRDNRLSQTLDRKDKEVDKKLEGHTEHFKLMLQTHDEKNDRDFAQVHKEIGEVREAVSDVARTLGDIRVDVAAIKAAREEKATIMAAKPKE